MRLSQMAWLAFASMGLTASGCADGATPSSVPTPVGVVEPISISVRVFDEAGARPGVSVRIIADSERRCITNGAGECSVVVTGGYRGIVTAIAEVMDFHPAVNSVEVDGPAALTMILRLQPRDLDLGLMTYRWIVIPSETCRGEGLELEYATTITFWQDGPMLFELDGSGGLSGIVAGTQVTLRLSADPFSRDFIIMSQPHSRSLTADGTASGRMTYDGGTLVFNGILARKRFFGGQVEVDAQCRAADHVFRFTLDVARSGFAR